MLGYFSKLQEIFIITWFWKKCRDWYHLPAVLTCRIKMTQTSEINTISCKYTDSNTANSQQNNFIIPLKNKKRPTLFITVNGNIWLVLSDVDNIKHSKSHNVKRYNIVKSYLMSSRLITAALSCRLSSGILSTIQSPKLVKHTKQFSECWPPAVVNCAIPMRRTRAPSWAVSLYLPIGFKLGSVKT